MSRDAVASIDASRSIRWRDVLFDDGDGDDVVVCVCASAVLPKRRKGNSARIGILRRLPQLKSLFGKCQPRLKRSTSLGSTREEKKETFESTSRRERYPPPCLSFFFLFLPQLRCLPRWSTSQRCPNRHPTTSKRSSRSSSSRQSPEPQSPPVSSP